MPAACHCHAILLSRRDTSDVMLTPQDMVVQLFALSLLPMEILPVVLRYVFPKLEALMDVNGGTGAEDEDTRSNSFIRMGEE